MSRTSYKTLVAQGRAITKKGGSVESYEELVAEGQRIVKQDTDNKWTLGDLTLKVEKQYGENKLGQYATDIDIEYSTLRSYRAVAKAWPKMSRSGTHSWTVHRELSARDDRFELIKQIQTLRDVYALLGRAPIDQKAPQKLTVDEKAQQATELLRDPKVTEQVINDPMTSSRITQAQAKKYAQIEQGARRNVASHQEANPELTHATNYLQSAKLLGSALSDMKRAAELLRYESLTPDEKESIIAQLDRLSDVIELTKLLFKGESIDEEWARLTGGVE